MRAQRVKMGLAAAVLVLITTGCSGPGSGGASTSTPTATPSSRGIEVLAIGDSDATGVGDPAGLGWVGRYVALLQRRLGRDVNVTNAAADGKSSDELRADVSDGTDLRKAIAGADVLLIGIGGADLNPGDDALSAGTCKGRACYAKILHTFDGNIAAVAGTLHHLAPNALLRAMSLPNAYPGAGSAIPPFITADISRYQVLAERDAVCRAMRANGGRCVDVVGAFNGKSATADAYKAGLMTKKPCCYPSGEGQQRIAELLLASGVPGGR